MEGRVCLRALWEIKPQSGLESLLLCSEWFRPRITRPRKMGSEASQVETDSETAIWCWQ